VLLSAEMAVRLPVYLRGIKNKKKKEEEEGEEEKKKIRKKRRKTGV
jgi:hypothetical protein